MAGFSAVVKGAAPRGGWRPPVIHRPRRGRGAYRRPREKRRWQAEVHESLAGARFFLQQGSSRSGGPATRKGGENMEVVVVIVW